MGQDPLDSLAGKEACPVCGTISERGTTRCPECGTFHSGVHLEEREAPPPEARISARDSDPSDYSLDPNAAIIDEDFDADEAAVKSWSGGSTDFSFVDDGPPVAEEKKENCLFDELVEDD
jgi:predicted  nucleic acid-binding Zn-ribbon protein